MLPWLLKITRNVAIDMVKAGLAGHPSWRTRRLRSPGPAASISRIAFWLARSSATRSDGWTPDPAR